MKDTDIKYMRGQLDAALQSGNTAAVRHLYNILDLLVRGFEDKIKRTDGDQAWENHFWSHMDSPG